MKRYDTSDIRNIALISHGGHGSTSLGEALLFASGAVNRLGSVDEGNTVLDHEEEEKERKSSTTAGVACCEFDKKKINIIDLPGLADFVGDVDGCLRAADAAILVVDAASGLQVRSEKLWKQAGELGLPRAIFINKMDRERADFERTLEDIKESLGVNPICVSIPIGAEDKLRGIVNVLRQKAWIYPMNGGNDFERTDVPADLAERVNELHIALVEDVAATDEELMVTYFEEGDFDEDTMKMALVRAFKNNEIVPVLAGSATTNVGTRMLLHFIADVCPSPAESQPKGGHLPDKEDPVQLERSDDSHFSGYVFKSIKDKYGKISLFKVESGHIEKDSNVYNANKHHHERLGAISAIRGHQLIPVDAAACGDIVAVAKLRDTDTGDTLCEEHYPIAYPGIPQLYPAMTLAIQPDKQGDEDKIYQRLLELREEDPSLQITRDKLSGTLLSGMGQLHIDATLKKLFRKFGIHAHTEDPKIDYRETIKGKVENVRWRHKKQTGGKGQFAECIIDVMPAERGEGYEFIDNIVGGTIPRQYIPAVDRGIMETMDTGVLSGHRVVDIKVRLFDGKYHDVDSSEMAFKIAGRMAFKTAVRDPKAKACLLEPVVEMEITVPEEAMGDVMGDLSSRRGRPMGMESRGKYQVIKATVPQAEVLRYSPDLRSMTGGRGDFVMRFSHYEEVPHEISAKLIGAYKDEDEEH